MQKIFSSLIILVLCLVSIPVVFGSPLVFKATKELLTNDVTELGSFDASKFRQIRIAIISTNRIEPKSKSVASIEVQTAIRNAIDTKTYGGSAESIAEAEKKLEDAQKASLVAIDTSTAGIFGMEDDAGISLSRFIVNESILIDIPPSKITIKGYGKGTYKIFIWAS